MYIGNDLQVAESGNKIIDDISSSFNGSTTSFALLVGGAAPVPFPINTQQIYISVNGVIQEPDPTGSAGFKLLGNNIVFSSAPANGHAFFGVILSGADYVTVGTEFPAGSATAPSITFGNDNNTGLYSVTGGTMGFTSDGVQTFTLDGDGFKLPDNKKLLVGSSSDLQLYHDSSSNQNIFQFSAITRFRTNSLFSFQNSDGSEVILKGTPDAAVELYYNNTKRFETTNTGTNVTGIHVDDGATHDGDVTFTGAAANVTWDKSEDDLIFADNAKAAFGTSSDLTLYHDGSDSWIRDTGTGRLLIDGSEIHIRKYGAAETMAKFIEDGAVELYHNNVKKFETTSYGLLSSNQVRINSSNATTVGFSCGDAGTGFYNSGSNAIGYSANGTQKWNINSAGDLSLVDGVELKLGTGDDLVIKHDSANTYFTNITGDLVLNSDSIRLRKQDGLEDYLKCIANGAVELYHNGVKKVETNASGVSIPDSTSYMCGDGSDLQIYHSSSVNTIRNIGTRLDIIVNSNENAAKFNPNGSVELYHDNIKTLETTATGCTIQKTASNQNADLVIDSTNGGQARLYLKTSLGGTNRAARIDFSNQGSEQWTIINDYAQDGTNEFSIRHGAEIAIACDPDGAVELYYDNDKRLSTWSDGINIYGDEGEDAILHLYADDGDDNADKWRISSTHVGNMFTIETYASGSWLKVLSGHDNASLQLHFAGNKKFETLTNGAKVTGNHYVQSSGQVELAIGSTNAGGAMITFDGDSNGDWSGGDYSWIMHNTDGHMEYNADNPGGATHHIFKAAGSEKLRFQAAGGISFNGDTAAANALDDYEEGTFVSNLTATDLTLTSNTYTCYYTKIGRVVIINGYAQGTTPADISAYVANSSHSLGVTNLPFNIINSVGARGAAIVGVNAGFTISNNHYLSTHGTANSNSFSIWQEPDTNGTRIGPVLSANTGMALHFSFTYQTT